MHPYNSITDHQYTIVIVIINVTIVDEANSRVMKRTIWVDDQLQNEFGDPLSNIAHADNRFS